MLPEILLDDVRFQELVSEARTRIVRHAPEWTEHNVSDPGITLIELYAWLTELLVYRINRIPERLHFGLLALVGVTPRPPECASVMVRWPSDSIFASLCARFQIATCSVQQTPQRMPQIRFATIASPFPEPPSTIPRSTSPRATASATGRMKSG